MSTCTVITPNKYVYPEQLIAYIVEIWNVIGFLFLVVYVCCPLVFEFSVGIGGFVIGLGQISFFFSSNLIWVLKVLFWIITSIWWVILTRQRLGCYMTKEPIYVCGNALWTKIDRIVIKYIDGQTLYTFFFFN